MNVKMNPIAIIPHYNHSDKIGQVVLQLLSYALPVLIVDDGSTPQHQAVLTQLAEQEKNVFLVFREQNGGKGAAVKTGLKQAWERGFSHAIQVDADGQHNLADVQKMLATSQQNPTACICGRPIYDDNAPKSRLYGRKITNFWITMNTLSFDIDDGMCGFRLYPLATTVLLIEREKMGDRMDFDIEILVRLHWQNVPMLWIDTPVKYELGGVSHFQGFADNWRISKMHARLFFTMLWRVITRKMR